MITVTEVMSLSFGHLCSFWPLSISEQEKRRTYTLKVDIQSQRFERTCDIEEEMNNDIVPTFYFLNHSFICKNMNILSQFCFTR